MECRETTFEQGVLNVFVAYDDRSAGRRAMQLVWELERESPKEIQPLLWRFDVLAHPDCQQLAAADARRADLLIVSAASQELAAPIRSWLTAALSGKALTHRALVALLGDQGQTGEAGLPGLIFLQAVAKNAGLAFFAPSPQPSVDPPSNGDGVPDLEVLVDRGREELLQPTHGYRHWGINE